MTDEPSGSRERWIPEEGPILLWPDASGRAGRTLSLEVNVCPFPGCPERHVLVDGAVVEPGRPGKNEPDWAFTVSVEVDAPGEVCVEACDDAVALRWFTGALDAELRAALLRRFERLRSTFDAPMGERDLAATTSRTTAGVRWTSEPIAPDRLVSVLAAFQRGMASRGPGRRPPAPAPRIGRNDPCPCGSGKKYKRCCLGAA